jgi:hypothetical protein
METPKEYYYTYYSYEEWGRGYIGSRGCKCLPEEDIRYFGSFTDKTFKPTQKIILKSDYTSREEAYADEIILQQYYKVVKNSHFANMAYQTSTKFCLSKGQQIELGKKYGGIGGRMQYENKIGIHGLSFDERSKRSRQIGLNHKKNKTGLCGLTLEERSDYGKIGGKKAAEINKKNKTSFWDPKLQSKMGKKGGAKSGSENAKKLNNQKWQCTETGYITNPGALTAYQRKRGIDSTKRVRISEG